MEQTSGPDLRAFIYDRNSRIGKKGSTSTQDQGEENRRFCAARGWTVVAEFEDAGRGASRHSKVTRPDYDAMLQRVEQGIRAGGRHAECDVVVVWGASRYARDLAVYVALRDLCVRAGVLLCYNGRLWDLSKGDDRFATGLDALQAEREAENIREGILRTTRANAERGRPHGRIPYGYERTYDTRTGALIGQVIHEGQAAVVREIAERIAGGQSCNSIAVDLNRRGVPTPGTSARWTLEGVGQLVVKPTYIGKRQHQGQVIGDASWEPILDEVVYYACLKILRDPARLTQHGSAVKYLLSGIALCGACAPGEQWTLRPQRVGPRWSYMCTECFRVSIRVPMMDRAVEIAVLAYMEKPGFARALSRRGGDASVRGALAEADELGRQLAEARQLAGQIVNGRMALSAASLAALEGRLEPLIEAARVRARDASVPSVLYDLAGPGARERWGGLDIVQQRAALRGLVRVYLNRAGKGCRVVRPERFTWEWLR